MQLESCMKPRLHHAKHAVKQKVKHAKRALWQVHILMIKKINHTNQQHQFDLLYMPHNIFEIKPIKGRINSFCCCIKVQGR